MTDSIDSLKIDTPENVTFQYEVAGIGSRFVAALVDTVLILLLQVPLIGVLVLVASQFSALSPSAVGLAWTLAILGLVSFLFLWGYYIFFEMLWNGQTPGKRWIGLRVIRLDGTPVTASEVVIRNLVRVLDILPTAYGVGIVTMFISENSRRLGDLAAGTVVVHEGKPEVLNEPPPVHFSNVAADSHLPSGFPLGQVTESEVQIIEEFLRRHDQLSNRKTLAGYILSSISSRLDLAQDFFAGRDPEDVLAALYKALKGRDPDQP